MKKIILFLALMLYVCTAFTQIKVPYDSGYYVSDTTYPLQKVSYTHDTTKITTVYRWSWLKFKYVPRPVSYPDITTHDTVMPVMTVTSRWVATKGERDSFITKVGILPHNVDIDTKIKIAKELNVKYVREGTLNWRGRDNNFDEYIQNGFKVLYNVSANGQTGLNFSKDTATFKNTVSDILNKYIPEVLVIENEEDNWGYHQRNTIDYVNEARAVIPIAKKKNVKIANGGLHDDQILPLAWRYYNVRGMKDSADLIFGLMNDRQQFAAQHPERKDNKLVQKIAQTDSLLNYYRQLSFDFINIHIYAPIGEFLIDSMSISNAVQIVADYVRIRTGKQVLSNECGQHDNSPVTVNYLLAALRRANYEYAIWFSGDGDDDKGNPAYSLSNSDGSLRSNGIAFQNFLIANP